MDPLSGLALTAVMLAVWGYVTYFAVRKGVEAGLRNSRTTVDGRPTAVGSAEHDRPPSDLDNARDPRDL